MELVKLTNSDLICERKGHAGVITFNRPEALNALSLTMILSFQQALSDFAHDPFVKLVIVKGKGSKAFCSGGDLKLLYEAKQQEDTSLIQDLFRQEYTNNYRISQFPKPYIAFMNGITMGGGMGMSIYASHRIVSETSKLAMPEVGIGFYPDIGASYFLNKIRGEIGTYMAVTGSSLDGSDALYTGLGTHYIPTVDQRDLEEQLYCCQSSGEIDAALNFYQAPLEPRSSIRDDEDHIKEAFCHDTMEGIFEALTHQQCEFSEKTLQGLRRNSPISQKLTLALQRWGEGKSLKECLNKEFSVTLSMIEGSDFFEGIRAQLIDKDKSPQWSVSSLTDVNDGMIESLMTLNHHNVLDLSPCHLENLSFRA